MSFIKKIQFYDDFNYLINLHFSANYTSGINFSTIMDIVILTVKVMLFLNHPSVEILDYFRIPNIYSIIETVLIFIFIP